jgi:EAL domain-containing protein (putative c-di-GMP-specific phosphodiesterase class I)
MRDILLHRFTKDASRTDARTVETAPAAQSALAADMALTCVVEGVETEEQRAALPSGIHLQGFLTDRPQQPEK